VPRTLEGACRAPYAKLQPEQGSYDPQCLALFLRRATVEDALDLLDYTCSVFCFVSNSKNFAGTLRALGQLLGSSKRRPLLASLDFHQIVCVNSCSLRRDLCGNVSESWTARIFFSTRSFWLGLRGLWSSCSNFPIPVSGIVVLLVCQKRPNVNVSPCTSGMLSLPRTRAIWREFGAP
jgi:hypothetical protein